MRLLLKLTIFTFIIFASFSFAKAQAPINDNCNAALNINIPLDGFGMGIYCSDTINLSNSTIQIGEYFHYVQISAGTDKKSIWYKFHLPTARSINLELLQPSNFLPEDAAGFTVYYNADCLPGASAISGAKLTPVNKFGSSYNPCLLPGDYLVQVSAKADANDEIFLRLTVDEPMVLNGYDRPANAQFLDVISGGYHSYTFDVGCQTIEDADENCPNLGANYEEYTQSTWHVFTTDNFVDMLRWELREQHAFYTGNLRVGYNLYKGDARSTPISSLTLIDGCSVLHPTGYRTTYEPNYAGKTWLCLLEPNSTYSLQVFYHKDYSNTIEFRWYERGVGNSHSADPSSLPPSAEMDTLPSSPTGVWSYAYDTLSCDALIGNNPCGNVNPASGTVNFGGSNYNSSVWYTFTITDYSNVRFNTDSRLGKRLFAGNVKEDCSLSPIWEFTSGNITYPCLPAGTYSLQILGKMDTLNYITSYNSNNLGMAANLGIQVTSIDIENNFQLTSSGDIDSLNNWMPLQNGVTVYADSAYFGCPNTVLPAGNNCSTSDRNRKKAIYREFVIDTLGMVTIGRGDSYTYLEHILYKGDASALATAQNKFSYGETIDGLTAMSGCFNFYYNYSRIFCVTPGVYTLVTFGDSVDVSNSYLSRPWVRFDKRYTQFYDPNFPNDMGDITASVLNGSASGTPDYFSCINNPLTIDGRAPCYSYVKQIYRQFYISQPIMLNISCTNYAYFRLFKGKVSDGVNTLSANIPNHGDIGCIYSYNGYNGGCIPFDTGWYTVVCYGSGDAIYEGPTYLIGTYLYLNNITISKVPQRETKYNRPHKAYYAGITDYGPNAGTSTYPDNSRIYTFDADTFSCVVDTPFSAHPLDPCPPNYNRVSYFTFTLTKESFVSIYNISTSMVSRVYPFDVRTDSVLMMSVPPIQPCISRKNISSYDRSYWTWTGKIDICRLQPGTHTLVVFGNNSHINATVKPIMYVDSIPISRFDHAANAYDFDLVPGDSLVYYGKVGDVNPIDTARHPSDDFISCLTGARLSDPGLVGNPHKLCWKGLHPYDSSSSILYPITENESVYDTLGTTNRPVRRNIWYTFVVEGPGKVYVSVNNRTPGKSTYVLPFAIYKSDVDGELSFSEIKANGEIDSTLASGLTYIKNNSTFDSYGCAGNLQTISFSINSCEPLAKRRYYVVVDEHVGVMVSNQLDISVKFESVPIIPLRYDHYSEANVINGLNESDPPYTDIALGVGTYSGYPASFACATKAPTDQNTCGTRTLWYKFTSDVSGKIRINYNIDGKAATATTNGHMLFKEIIPGDSTDNGLAVVPLTIINDAGVTWAEHCLNRGTYYLMMTGCNYTIEVVKPNIWLIEEIGDLCSNPISLSLSSPGSTSASVSIDCHSIGEDYGEDGSAMGCLFGPEGYKTTWFKINLNMNINVDLSFQLAENTTALPSQIRYRVLYGSCDFMTAGPCNSDALTEFTLNCMATDSNDYYVQIVSPVSAKGELTLTVKADSAPNQSCVPFNPIAPVANFTVINACAGDSICFVNQSTLGDSIAYFWDFGVPELVDDTSNLKDPCWLYPIPPSNDTVVYMVTLIATNNVHNSADTIIIGVPVYPLPLANITREAPQDGYYVSAGGVVNFFSNSSNTISVPPAEWYWNLSNGTFSTDTNPSGVIYGPADLGLNVVTLQLSNGECIIVVTDTFFVKYEDVYVGGINDGASASLFEAYCPPDSAWIGGINDGAALAMFLSDCPPDSVWVGGINDGAAVSLVKSDCPPDSAWIGGFYDGAAVLLLKSDCPPDSVWVGGINDGAAVSLVKSDCPADSAWIGGFYDGSAMSQQLASCFEYVYSGGFYDGASVNFLTCSEQLPIQLLELTAFWDNDDGIIQWITASEISNSGFFVQKRNSENEFIDVGFVNGAGNSNELNVYTWVDYNLINSDENEFYYRLKQVDFDGQYTTTDVVVLSKNSISNSDCSFTASLFPNPASQSGAVNVLINNPEEGNISIFITDILGRTLYSAKTSIQSGLVLYQLPELNLSPAKYNVMLIHSSGQIVLPFIITK